MSRKRLILTLAGVLKDPSLHASFKTTSWDHHIPSRDTIDIPSMHNIDIPSWDNIVIASRDNLGTISISHLGTISISHLGTTSISHHVPFRDNNYYYQCDNPYITQLVYFLSFWLLWNLNVGLMMYTTGC